jgi:two-component system LytT family response regulator
MSIRVLVVDDEQLTRRSILDFLRDWKDVEIIGECVNGTAAVKAIRQHSPDLVFLDMQMPGMNGLEVVGAIGEENMPFTIFVTAHDKYAVKAFEANAVDYVLKPFGKERFQKAFSRAIERMGKGLPGGTSTQLQEVLNQLKRQEEYVDRIPITSNGRISFVRVEDISCLEAERNSVRILVGKQSFEIRDSLSALEQRLDPKHFLRIHRSTIVHLCKVKEVQPWFNGFHVVVLEDGRQLRMSRYQQDSLRRLMGHAPKVAR